MEKKTPAILSFYGKKAFIDKLRAKINLLRGNAWTTSEILETAVRLADIGAPTIEDSQQQLIEFTDKRTGVYTISTSGLSAELITNVKKIGLRTVMRVIIFNL